MIPQSGGRYGRPRASARCDHGPGQRNASVDSRRANGERFGAACQAHHFGGECSKEEISAHFFRLQLLECCTGWLYKHVKKGSFAYSAP
jgi:hypothetical protein